MNISVIGLGKLGLSMAVAIASKTHQVIGVDTSPLVLQKIKAGISPIQEPEVETFLRRLMDEGRFRATSDFETAVFESELSFIAVNTPEQIDGGMDLSQVKTASQMIAQVLKEKSDFHVIATSSTILPETTDRVLKPICEEISGKKAGKDFGLCVNPVFIALTTVVRDFLSPPVVVIGESDKRSGDILSQLYSSICNNQPHHIRTSPLMAEFIKMAHNAYATTKMAFMNEMAGACSRIPDADVRVLTQFFQLGGERAGRFLEAGLGFGGPCFPRDLRFFLNYLKTRMPETPLVEAIQHSNQEHAVRIVELIEEELGQLRNRKISILGLAYKPNIAIAEESFSLKLIDVLLLKGTEIIVFDPRVKELKKIEPNGKLHMASHMGKALADSECCILATPWEELRHMEPAQFKQQMKKAFVFDPWRFYERSKIEKNVDRYLSLGVSSGQDQVVSRSPLA